jgi:ribonuclease HI
MIDTTELPDVTIYTDGACDPNPGPGGWAVLLLFGRHKKTLTGNSPNTTNNQMELQAVISGLEGLNRPCRVRLHTDSEYVHKGVTEYLARWKAKGWRTSDKKPVANRELWEALDAAMQRHAVEWVWVKGHAGDPHNEEVDRLAVAMISRPDLPTTDQGAAHIFAGASCLGATGPGGWAVVVRIGEATHELAGREEKTSANRLHLLAAVRGLAELPADLAAHLYTASDYVAQGAERWVRTWERNGWRTKEGQPLKHSELWQAVLKAQGERHMHWHCIKGNMPQPAEAQRADALAQEAAR